MYVVPRQVSIQIFKHDIRTAPPVRRRRKYSLWGGLDEMQAFREEWLARLGTVSLGNSLRAESRGRGQGHGQGGIAPTVRAVCGQRRNLVDMSNTQQGGEAERYIGEFCARKRGTFVLARTFGGSTDSNDPNARGTHRKNLLQSVEKSLTASDGVPGSAMGALPGPPFSGETASESFCPWRVPSIWGSSAGR